MFRGATESGFEAGVAVNELPGVISLGPEDEAARLWTGAKEAYQHAPVSLVSLCEFLDLGIRAAEILVFQQLQLTRQEFPATIAQQLETPIPEVDTYRDAVAVPTAIQFTESHAAPKPSRRARSVRTAPSIPLRLENMPLPLAGTSQGWSR
jgi:hypothetical protein